MDRSVRDGAPTVNILLSRPGVTIRSPPRCVRSHRQNAIDRLAAILRSPRCGGRMVHFRAVAFCRSEADGFSRGHGGESTFAVRVS